MNRGAIDPSEYAHSHVEGVYNWKISIAPACDDALVAMSLAELLRLAAPERCGSRVVFSYRLRIKE